MNESPFIRRDILRRGGFTLIEVVIALAIFVFGALAIIRIFPPALGVIQNSGDRLVGINLNRSLLARYDKQPQKVPDGTFDTIAESAPANWRKFDPLDPLDLGKPGSVMGTRRNNSLPVENIQEFDKSALGHFKNIVGEKHSVPSSKIILTQFPFGTVTPIKVYREDTLSGVVLKANGELDFSTAVRNSDGSTYTTPIATDMGYVSYRWVENSKIWNADEERVSFATTPVKVAQTTRTASQIVPGEVVVRLRSSLTPATTDPERGYLTMNASDAVGMKISLDYTVTDWRWLVYDGIPSATVETPPTATTRYANLPVRLLDTTQPKFLYTIFPSNSTTPTPITKDSTDADYADPNVAKTSRIPFELGSTNVGSSNVRVVYRTLDNWAQQLSVAASNYTLYYNGITSNDVWRECALSSTGGYLYFHPGEAGKTVLLSYTYTASAVEYTVSGRVLTIDTSIIEPIPSDVPTGFAATEGRVARLQLTDLTGNTLAAPPTSIQKIKGVGIQTRTAWLDGNRFNQVSAVSYRGDAN